MRQTLVEASLGWLLEIAPNTNRLTMGIRAGLCIDNGCSETNSNTWF
jgi:hypothetical protein